MSISYKATVLEKELRSMDLIPSIGDDVFIGDAIRTQHDLNSSYFRVVNRLWVGTDLLILKVLPTPRADRAS